MVCEKRGVIPYAPESLSAFSEGYKLAQYQDDGSGEVYFINKYSDNLIRYDPASREFTELEIAKDSLETYISSLYINPQGDILVCMDGQDSISTKNDFASYTGKFVFDVPEKEENASEPGGAPFW